MDNEADLKRYQRLSAPEPARDVQVATFTPRRKEKTSAESDQVGVELETHTP